jgi:hypothetical protein
VGQPERSRLVQTARFRPRGLLGLAYWYGVMRLAEADARAARRAKESGAAGQVVTVEPSQSTVPGHWTKVH